MDEHDKYILYRVRKKAGACSHGVTRKYAGGSIIQFLIARIEQFLNSSIQFVIFELKQFTINLLASLLLNLGLGYAALGLGE